MKIRKFRAGDTVVDTSDSAEAKDKAAGLAASNAEKKSSGFLGLGRLFEGNIDEKGSEAYNKYGAGYGREVEARNSELKEITERDAENARSEARTLAANKKIADIKERAAAAESESDYRGPMQRRKLDVSEPAPAAPAAPAKAPAAPAKAPAPVAKASTASTGSTGSTSESDYRGPMQRRKLSVSEPASGSGGGRGPSYAQVDAEKQKGFTASSTSTDPAQRAAATAARAAAAAKAAADAPKVRNPETDEGEDVRPASQAQLKALAAIARATGNTSGVASGRITAAEAARKITEYAKKAKDTASSFSDFFKKEKYKAKGGAIQSYAKGGSVSASSRGDGIAQRGKTRGRVC